MPTDPSPTQSTDTPAADSGLDGTPSMAPAPVRPHLATAVSRAHRSQRIVAVVLVLAGLALLFVTLRAQDLGLAPTAGPGRTQVVTGILGTLLVAVGLSLVVQPFVDWREPPVER